MNTQNYFYVFDNPQQVQDDRQLKQSNYHNFMLNNRLYFVTSTYESGFNNSIKYKLKTKSLSSDEILTIGEAELVFWPKKFLDNQEYWPYGTDYISSDYFFGLTNIKIFKESERGKGLGTRLMSTIIEDIKKFNSLNGQKYPIVFEKLSAQYLLDFYKKFGATVCVDASKSSSKDHTIIMKIEPPLYPKDYYLGSRKFISTKENDIFELYKAPMAYMQSKDYKRAYVNGKTEALIKRYYTNKYFLYSIKDNGKDIANASLCLIEDRSGSINGCVDFTEREKYDKYFYLQLIEVTREYQQQGIATKLLKEILNDVTKFNNLNNTLYPMLLESVKDQYVQEFYQKHGAQKADRRVQPEYLTWYMISGDNAKHNRSDSHLCFMKALGNNGKKFSKDMICKNATKTDSESEQDGEKEY